MSNIFLQYKCQIIPIKIMLCGRWGKENAIVSNNCILVLLKNMLITKLIQHGIISNTELNERNKLNHIKLWDNNINSENLNIYDMINGLNHGIDIGDVRIYRNMVIINLTRGLYFIVIYKKNIDINREKITSLISEVFNECNNNFQQNEHINDLTQNDNSYQIRKVNDTIINFLQKNKESPEDLTCVICLDEKRNCCIDCGHVSMCIKCSASINNCPICRKPITNKIKIFMS